MNGFRLMMKLLETDKMDKKNKMPVLVFFFLYISQVSAGIENENIQLEVDITDGEVTAIWKSPVGDNSDFVYNVQMKTYSGEWVNISSCTKITETYCQLSSFIQDYKTAYVVNVQMVKGEKVYKSASKKFLLNEGKLLPPSITLWATSSTLTIRVHKKPILNKIYPYGVTYTIYMEERGQENKTTIVYLKDDDEAQRTATFTALHWGREYCVSISVEGNGALSYSRVSDQQCLFLPEQEFFIIAASSLSILGVFAAVAIMSSFLLCYLRRPAKTPTALKSPLSGWHSLSVSEGSMEVVTDKGWFLSNYNTEVRNSVQLPVSHMTAIEDIEEETRRTSLDSGLSIEADSGTESVENPPVRQEDSGCGSMGGSESSSDSPMDYPLQEERIDADEVRKREDSGLVISCQLDSSSLNLEGQDSEPLMKTVVVGNYRSQSPSEVQIQSSDSMDMLQQIPKHSLLAEVVTGYRAGPQSCICSGVGQCSWCHKYGHFGSELIKQHRLLGSRSELTNPYKGKHTFSAYSSKTHIDTVTINDLETTFLQINETFPVLTSLPLGKCEQDFNMNNLSLCDVQLTTD